MSFRLAADVVLVLHLSFILFALFGAVLAFRWRWIICLHLSAVAWGFFVEASGRICPLTYIENTYRQRAGQSGYSTSFVEHYLLPIIYPAGLTRDLQLVFATAVILLNLALYGWLWLRHRQHKSQP